ncbi:glycosyltransferase family 4 protein [Ktedonosporobacter rubrisoli]|uniref:Glycosyltransferase family 4 protein n=1 Tax=Ktedonosporobacter rubrisoli TaxID=2509675 RepID=A0A4P6JUL8_KTERU|nr:glycosyltransferase family 4 protein [Ktedonosporobacter rubrisoli]QBD79033.1 glycosyltransferase family 4 protein [Ktedonosporobacter rubrisoli]
MRVLMISKALVSGTSQRKLEEIARCPDVELTLVTPPYWHHDDGSKLMLERLYTEGYRMIVTSMALNGNYHLHYYPQLGRIMKEVRPEIVHIDEEPYNFATFHAMLLARQHKAKALFFTWQNLYRNYPPPFRQIELYNYHHAAFALAGNRDAVEILKRKGYNGRVQVIPQFGFDTEIYKRSAPRQPRQAGDPFTIGFLGRLKEEKGLPLIIDALSTLPDFCRAVFIGNGPMKSALEEQAARLGIAERVSFKPSVPTSQVPREIEQWDVHVLPSIRQPNWIEQFGRTLAEAMACETPVIGSNLGEIPYVIGDAGLVFQEGDVQDLSACIRKLLDNPALYADLASRGRQRVLDNYTQEQIARQTYDVYCQMLGVASDLSQQPEASAKRRKG